MKRTISWIRDYFGFSQQETKGFIVLSIILILLIISPLFLRLESNYTPQQLARDRQLLDSMQVLFAKQDVDQSRTFPKTKKAQRPAIPPTLFRFNPNTANQEQLIQLGLAPYLAKRIVKYRNKGGEFREKSDLLKIYGFPEKLYQAWLPYITLPKTHSSSINQEQSRTSVDEQNPVASEVTDEYNHSQKPAFSTRKFPKKNPIIFDLAKADTLQLQQIKGIGSKLSSRIIAFRDKLGGFHSVDQLQEVYGLKPEVLEELKKYARLEDQTPIQIDVNVASVKELAKHPYISYKLAKLIVNYRSQHGLYHSVEDLKKIKLIKQSFIDKIRPYLRF